MIFRDIRPPSDPSDPNGGQKISLKRLLPSFEKAKKWLGPKKSTAPAPTPQKFISIQENTQSAVNSEHIRSLTMLLIMACIILIVVNLIHLSRSGISLKQSLIETASQGFEKVIQGAVALKDGHFDQAKDTFALAEETFSHIQNQAWFTTPRLLFLTLHDPIFDAGNALIGTGKNLAQAGRLFSDAGKNLQFLPKNFFEENGKPLSSNRASLTEKLTKELPAIIASADALVAANGEIQKVPTGMIPHQLADRFNFAKASLGVIAGSVNILKDDIPAILTLLGDKEPHTFLILLQNNAELRPSGGFIGNIAIAETNDGYLTKNELSDVYSFDHQLVENLVPPEEISEVNTRWFLRDSNYSGHFPLSANKATWFLEKEGGPGVDSVIAIDQTFIRELLRLTGPIKIPELPASLTAENFSTVLSYMVEAKVTGREDPKAVLKSFLPAFEKALFKNVDPVSLLPLLQAQIQSKHLLAYSKDSTVQGFFQRHELSGEMKKVDPREDYLNVVHTSIGGNKSDDYMTEQITHDTYIHTDGHVSDEVSITRRHTWNDKVEKRILGLLKNFGFNEVPRPVLAILGGSRNLHALRIYVPAGSVLEESSDAGTEARMDQDTGLTYFAAKMDVAVNESKTLRIRYRLPFTLKLNPVDEYRFNIQKQPGQNGITLRKRLLPQSRVLNYKYFPANGAFDLDGVWNFETELKSDLSFSSIWGK
ncbi:MAG: DUF4012 domain-containing protein [Patescibacteria group bacterium]